MVSSHRLLHIGKGSALETYGFYRCASVFGGGLLWGREVGHAEGSGSDEAVTI